MPVAIDFFDTFRGLEISANPWVLIGHLINYVVENRNIKLEDFDKFNEDIEILHSEIQAKLYDVLKREKNLFDNPDNIVYLKAYNELIFLFVSVINEIQNGPISEAHLNLAKQIKSEDSIITFNWDTLMDRALNKETDWSPDFGYFRSPKLIYRDGWVAPENLNSNSFPILLKLHGSSNWLTSHTIPENGKLELTQEVSIDEFFVYVNNTEPYNCYAGRYMDGYEGYLESVWFAGLAYIYKTDTVEINALYEIYTSSEYWNYFPRSPMVMELTFMGDEFILINNHFKCCGDGLLDLNNDTDEETRRYYASVLLKEYIDTNWEDKNVILLGDLNDRLNDSEAHNVFQMFLDDANNYLFADYEIAIGDPDNWSFPGWPSHLDHILITDELFSSFNDTDAEVQTIKIDDYLQGGWSEYDSNISDHRPVALKLVTEGNLQTQDQSLAQSTVTIFPNPAKNKANLTINTSLAPTQLEIFTAQGQLVFSQSLKSNQTQISINTSQFSNGIYITKLLAGTTQVVSKKLVVLN